MRESREKRKGKPKKPRKDQKAPGPEEEVNSKSWAKSSFHYGRNSELGLREQYSRALL